MLSDSDLQNIPAPQRDAVRRFLLETDLRSAKAENLRLKRSLSACFAVSLLLVGSLAVYAWDQHTALVDLQNAPPILSESPAVSVPPSQSLPSDPVAQEPTGSVPRPDGYVPRPRDKDYENGETVKKSKPQWDLDCSFSVSAPAGHVGYYVYLDYEDTTKNMSFLVKPGQSAAVQVPAGTASVYYAYGRFWYGRLEKFGTEEAGYCRMIDPFRFQPSSDGSPSCSLDLPQQATEGPTHTLIPFSEFP